MCGELETCLHPTRVALIGEADVAGTASGRLLLLLLASLARLGVEGTFVDDDGLDASSPPACALLLLFRACHISQARQL
jgi:hypothetical protein